MRYALVIILSLIFSACDSEVELRQGIRTFPSGLDPAVNHDAYEYQIYAQIYEPLVRLSRNQSKILPCIAESWQISDDLLTYVFKLTPNIYFHDGNLLNAEDVKYSFNRQIKYRENQLLFSLIKDITVLDSLKLKITLTNPYSPFLYWLASPNGLLVMSKNSLQKLGHEIEKNPVGTGPYVLNKWIDGHAILLHAYPKYREIQTVTRLNFTFSDSSKEAEILFKEGKLDVLYMVAGYWIDRLKWLGQAKYYVQKPTNTLFMGFNLNNPPVNNRLIRKAILKSLDLKKNIIITNRGNAIAAHGPLPPIYTGFEDLKQEDYDNSEAKRLLKLAGYNNDLNLNLYVPEYSLSRKTKIEIIKNQLEDAGIKLHVTYLNSSDSYYESIKDGKCHIFLDGYSSELIGDPGNFLYALFHSKSSYNNMNYKNNEVDILLEHAFKEPGESKRRYFYRQVVKNVLSDIPAVFGAHVKPHFVYNSKKIQSLVASPYEYIYYHKLKLYN
jgi:peptide/nickel transport system substrate-binding protein